MDGFEKRKEQKKEQIRRAALELFQTFGFQKVSINDIAQRAGVSPVTIYNHFNSKEELIRDVLKWFVMDLFERYRNIMEGDLPFAEKMEQIVFDKTEVAKQFQGEFLQAYLKDDLDMKSYMDDLYANRIMPIMMKFFQEGIQQGYISSRFSIKTIMWYFEIIRRGFYGMQEIAEDVSKDTSLHKELIELMTYGLNG